MITRLEPRRWVPALTALRREICVLTGVDADRLQTTLRHAPLTDARRLAWQVIRLQGYTLPEIGRMTGGFDHSTVIAALRKVTQDEREVAEELRQFCPRASEDPEKVRTEKARREALFRANVRRWRELCAEDKGAAA